MAQTAPYQCEFAITVAPPWGHTAAARIPLVVRIDRVQPHEHEVFHRHLDFFALYLVKRGRGTHIIDGTPYAISRGDLYIMGLGVTHAYQDFEDLELEALYFRPDVFPSEVREALRETPGFLPLLIGEHAVGGRWLHLTPDACERIQSQIDELRSEWQRGTHESVILTQGLFFRLLVHIARQSNGGASLDTSPRRDDIVSAAVRHIDDRYADPVRIDQLAQSLFLSPDRFTEVFAETMGRTPRDYLRHVRIERAKVLLASSTLPIAEVGLVTGFPDPAYFARSFRSAVGCTPSTFRVSSRSAKG